MLASLSASAVDAQTLVPSRSPNVALIHIVPTPYFQQLHRAFRQALPGVTVYSLYTHSVADQPWKLSEHDDVRPIAFGASGANPDNKLANVRHDWATASRIIRWIKDNQIDAVVVYGYADAIRVRLIAWCRLHGIPCFLAADSNIRGDRQRAKGLKGVAKRGIVTGIVKACAGVMPFGTCGAEYFRKYGVAEHRIFPVPPGPDYTLFRSTTDADAAAARARFSLDPARKRLVFSGRLTSLKRVDLLIAAFARIAGERPDWDLLIIGDGEERASLEAAVPEALRSRVIFAGFQNDPRTLAALYRSSNALVLPSNTEAWGLVVNEALAAGCAAVTSDVVGASADLIVEGYNGRTFRNQDENSLVDALAEVTAAENIGRMQAASAAVLAAYRSRFDPVEGFRAALRSCGVLGGPRSSRRRVSRAIERVVRPQDELARQVA